MPFHVTVARNADYVRFTVAGTAVLRNFAGLIGTIADDVERFEDLRVLVDLRDVVGRLSTDGQILLGELAARRSALVFKMASLVRDGEVTRNSERAAISKGLSLRVFSSEANALAWLLEGQPD